MIMHNRRFCIDQIYDASFLFHLIKSSNISLQGIVEAQQSLALVIRFIPGFPDSFHKQFRVSYVILSMIMNLSFLRYFGCFCIHRTSKTPP